MTDMSEMQRDLIRVYRTNEILINCNRKLQAMSIDIAKRNNDVKGLSEVAMVLKEIENELNKIN